MKSISSQVSFACAVCLLLVSVAHVQGQDYLSGEDTLCNGLPCKSGDITTTTPSPTDETVAADSDSTNNDYVYAEIDRVVLFIGDRDTTTDSNSNNPNYLDSDVESVPTPSTFSPDY